MVGTLTVPNMKRYFYTAAFELSHEGRRNATLQLSERVCSWLEINVR